jgi:hypothetical protein
MGLVLRVGSSVFLDPTLNTSPNRISKKHHQTCIYVILGT